MSEIGLNINVDSYNNEGIKTIKGNNNAEIYKLYILKNKRRLSLVGKTVKLGYVMAGTTNGDVIENLNITNAEQGEITFPITNRISKQDGVYSCQLAIYGADGFLEHTATFGLTVEDNIFTKIAGEIADSKDFTYLENILDKASKLSEKLKENTSTATNANSNLESNITEANNINSKLLENTSTATSLNKNLESNIDLAKEVKETIKDLDTKNIEATEKIETLTGLNAKATELSNNIQQGLPLNSELVKNVESAKTVNNELIATNNDAKAKKTDLDNSLEEAKKYIAGLDGSKNPVQMQLDINELKNGLKSNQSLSYEGSSIAANNTLEGRTEGMRIGGRTLVNISPKGISDCSSISAFNHNYQEVKVEQGDGFVKCTQPLAKKYNILGYDNNNIKPLTNYIHIADVEIVNNPNGDNCLFHLSSFNYKKNKTINNGRGVIVAIGKTTDNVVGGNSAWIGVRLGADSSEGENRSFIVYNISTYEITEEESNKDIEELLKKYPVKCEGIKSFGEAEGNKISILSHGKNLFDGHIEVGAWKDVGNLENAKYDVPTLVRNTNPIKIKPNTQYIMNVGFAIRVNFYDKQGNLILQKSPLIENRKFISPPNSYYFCFNTSSQTSLTDVLNFKYQLEYGNVSTEYQKYISNKKDILIKEPLRSKGDICDLLYEDNGQVKIDRHVGIRKYQEGDEENKEVITDKINTVSVLGEPTTEIVENCVDIDLDTFGEKTYFSIENSIKGTLDFKVPSNIASIVQNTAREVNNIWDVINNLLVPGILKANGNLAMIKLNNNLK